MPILFYRSMLLAADVAPIDALFDALTVRGFAPAPLFVTSLKDAESAAFLRAAMPRLAMTPPFAFSSVAAFSIRGDAWRSLLYLWRWRAGRHKVCIPFASAYPKAPLRAFFVALDLRLTRKGGELRLWPGT